MVKEIEIYDGKKITVDFEKVYSYIAGWYMAFLFIIYILFQDLSLGLGVLTLKTIIYLAVTIIVSITIIGARIIEGNFKLSKYYIMFAVYLALISLSAIFSKYPDNVLLGVDGRGEGVVTLFCYMLTFCIIYEGFKFNKKLFYVSTVSVCIAGFYGILQAFLAGEYSFFGEIKYVAYSNFGNPNMFSSFLSIFLPIYIVKYFTSEKKIWLGICSLVFGALLVSRTTGGYVTFIIYFSILLGYFIICSENRKKTMLKAFVLVMIFTIIFVILNACVDNLILREFKGLFMEIENLDEKNGIEDFGTSRGYIWIKCIEILKENLLFGIGPDSLQLEMMNVGQSEEDFTIDKAHNEYLQIAVTTGVPSLILYLIFIYTVSINLLKKYINNVKENKKFDKYNIIVIAIAASIVSYLVQAFGNISVIGVAPLFWGILGMAAKLAENSKEMLEEK